MLQMQIIDMINNSSIYYPLGDLQKRHFNRTKQHMEVETMDLYLPVADAVCCPEVRQG
jgi:hypothetical protein